MIVLTLYSRHQCHLCDEMLAELEPLIEGKARVDIVDIDTDESLSRRFGWLIPVLMHDGNELSRLRLDRERVIELLDKSE